MACTTRARLPATWSTVNSRLNRFARRGHLPSDDDEPGGVALAGVHVFASTARPYRAAVSFEAMAASVTPVSATYLAAAAVLAQGPGLQPQRAQELCRLLQRLRVRHHLTSLSFAPGTPRRFWAHGQIVHLLHAQVPWAKHRSSTSLTSPAWLFSKGQHAAGGLALSTASNTWAQVGYAGPLHGGTAVSAMWLNAPLHAPDRPRRPGPAPGFETPGTQPCCAAQSPRTIRRTLCPQQRQVLFHHSLFRDASSTGRPCSL